MNYDFEEFEGISLGNLDQLKSQFVFECDCDNKKCCKKYKKPNKKRCKKCPKR